MKLFFKVFLLTLLFFSSIQLSAQNCTKLYAVTATQLNIRDQPNTSGSVIGAFHKDDQVCINQENGNWGRTDSGWVSKKHLVLLNTRNEDSIQSVSENNSETSENDATNGALILGIFIIIAFIFFGLKTLFYHTLITLGMAEPDGRAKNGIRLTRLGKFMASISGLIIFFIFMLIGSMSK